MKSRASERKELRGSETLKILEELRRAISAVEKALEAATGSEKERLLDDLKLYIAERKRLIRMFSLQ